MTTITVFHNVEQDAAGRHTGMLDGYKPTDRLVPVFQYDVRRPLFQHDVRRLAPAALLAQAFELFNIGEGVPAADNYRSRGNRSLSVGDVVALADDTLATTFHAVDRFGWREVPAPLVVDATAAVYGSTGLYAARPAKA